jgi:cold shock protein
MGKKGRDRSSRRREFGDDAFDGGDTQAESPRQAFRRPPQKDTAPAGAVIEATVTWFNAEKGFGFVELGDGSGDAFLHVAVLRKGGHEVVTPETKLRVQIGQGQKGRQVTAILEVDESSAGSTPLRLRTSPHSQANATLAAEIAGTVKWFKSEKGFGFAVAEDGGKDVFIHISIVHDAGMGGLADGQRVLMRVVNTQKGREAVSITLAE